MIRVIVQMYAIIIMLLATYAAAGQQKGKKTGLRVYDGASEITGKYPYVVALKGTYPALLRMCTGSLIKDTWVLSAAHCLLPSVKYIQWGNMSTPLAATKTKSVVLKMISHPAYLGPSIQSNDLGLVMVQRVIDVKTFARVSAIDYKSLLGQPVEYAGFGMTYIPKTGTHNKVQEFVRDIFRPLQIGEAVVTLCGDIFRANLICARAKCSHSLQMVLKGDSGGPLIFENKIIGVAHAIIYDTFEQSFTPVSPFLTWIYSVITADHTSRPTTAENAPIARRPARIIHTSY